MSSIAVWANEKPEPSCSQRNLRIECRDRLNFLTTDFIVFRIDRGIVSSLPVLDIYLPSLAMLAMAEAKSLHIHGPVSREALVNVREYQEAWSAWMPTLFRNPVDITADTIIDVMPPRPDRAIQAFSGGVDAHFTTWLHRKHEDEYRRRPLDRAVFAHGFDIARSDEAAFAVASQKARRVLDTVGVELSTVKTNIRSAININWEMLHGPAIAAILGQFIPDYTIGLIGSSNAYGALRTPWGSNPITDPLMSGGAMRFQHDGAGYSRNDKVKVIAGWPLAAENLRVCWKGAIKSENCGVCGKCIRTALAFEVWDLPVPSSLKSPITPEDIARCDINNHAQLEAYEEILTLATRNGIRKSWVNALRRRVRDGRAGLESGLLPSLFSRPASKVVALRHQ